ncbi:MAG: GNAT family N-acetyltransferase [Dehalococcoidia bacterium]
MSIDYRIIGDGDLAGFDECQRIGMVGDPSTAEILERRKLVQELDRSIAAFDDGQVVGTASAFTKRLTTPGGEVAMGGLTMVSVRSTHRRKGILTEMMRRHFEDCVSRNEPLSGLYAAEAPIYGRFGYGIATEQVDLKIDRDHSTLEHLPEIRGRTRMIPSDQAREQWPPVWDAVRQRQPGMLDLSQAWWSRMLFDPVDRREGMTALRHVNYEVDGEVQGFVMYRQKDHWEENLPAGRLKVVKLIAATAEAYAGLWQYLFGIDWMKTIECEHRAPDEPLYHMLLDARRLRRTPDDGVWLRILDVERALGARTYAVDGRVTFEVHDPFLPGVGGRFLLEAGAGGATCRRADRGGADAIRLGIAELSAAYLGGTRLSTLARAGRVTGDEAAIRLADLMFWWDLPPWCPEGF